MAVVFWHGISFSQNNTHKIAIDDNGLGKQFPDCMMSGSVCNLFPTGANPKLSVANAFKTGEISFSIEIKKTAISEEKQIAILGKLLKNINNGESVFFSITAPFIVEKSFLQLLEISPSNNIITVGNYPIEITAEYIIIKLSLSDH